MVSLVIYVGIIWFAGELRVGMPEHIGTAKQLSGANDHRAQAAAQEFENAVHAPTDVAMYQTTDGTRFIAFASAVDSVWAMPVLREMAAGAQEAGGSVTLIQAYSFENAGVSFACAPVASPIPGALCLWADGETVGGVFGDGLEVKRAEGLIVEAQDAVDD